MAHPRMYDDAHPAIRRLRAMCMALPETFEKEAWGECTFRVAGGSMFAMTDSNHHGSKHQAVWVKAPRDVQEMLVAADAKRFFVPPYVGSKGWIGVRLDYKVDWEELGDILKDGYAMSAPKRLRAAATGDVDAAPHAAAKRGRARATTRAAGRTPKPKQRAGGARRSREGG